MQYDLPTLNRLRLNAGKTELKSWKGSAAKLKELIDGFVKEGFTDTVPGANLQAKPTADDPNLTKPFDPPEEKKDDKGKKGKSKKGDLHPAIKSITSTDHKTTEIEKPVKKPQAVLAKGLETDSMARQSRIAAQMERERVRKEEKEEKKAAKLKAKEEAKADKPKKDKKKSKKNKDKPAKEEKSKAKKETPVKKSKAGDNEITVADIARDLKIDPKVARAKLRRHEAKLDKLHTKGQDRWTFPKSAKDEIVKILKP